VAVVDRNGGHLSWFQILAVAALGGLLLRDLIHGSRSPAALAVSVLRCGVWVGAVIAIVVPGLVQPAAELLGIGREADVVLYLSVLTFTCAAFFLYARCLRLEREITALTRHLAIRDAVRGRAGQEAARPAGG
jgi:hypothetical protein